MFLALGEGDGDNGVGSCWPRVPVEFFLCGSPRVLPLMPVRQGKLVHFFAIGMLFFFFKL